MFVGLMLRASGEVHPIMLQEPIDVCIRQLLWVHAEALEIDTRRLREPFKMFADNFLRNGPPNSHASNMSGFNVHGDALIIKVIRGRYVGLSQDEVRELTYYKF